MCEHEGHPSSPTTQQSDNPLVRQLSDYWDVGLLGVPVVRQPSSPTTQQSDSVPVVRQLVSPTTQQSDSPVVRQPSSPTAQQSDNPVVRQPSSPTNLFFSFFQQRCMRVLVCDNPLIQNEVIFVNLIPCTVQWLKDFAYGPIKQIFQHDKDRRGGGG